MVLDGDLPAMKAVRKYEVAQYHADETNLLWKNALHEMDLHKAWDT